MRQRSSTEQASTAPAWVEWDGAWYEQHHLSQAERRRRGHYSTPPDLVARMLDWVGYDAGADLEHLALLDPSCGGGNFLAAATERLIAYGRALGWPARRILAAVQANLWGLETDPIACALAELRLQALIRPLAGKQHLLFHIHQADALALAATPRFQFVVGNPPYLSVRKSHLEAYQHCSPSGGQRDAYLLFLEQACRLVAPGGRLGLVLPDPLLARANAAEARRLLQESFTLRRLLHLEGVFRAEVGTLVLIAERVPPPASVMVPWSRLDWRKAAEKADQQGAQSSDVFAAHIWRQQPRAEIRYLLGLEETRLFERLAREIPAVLLGDLVRIGRGEELSRGAVEPLQPGAEDGDLLPVLRGGRDVLPFRCRYAGVALRRSQIAKPLERYLAPKLLVVKSTARLCAALDEHGYVALQTLYLLHLTSDEVLHDYLLALLNSRLLRGYLWLHHTAYKLVQPQIEQEALARVPVPLLPLSRQQEIGALAGDLRKLYEEQDGWDQETLASSTQKDVQVAPTPPHRRFKSALGACGQEVPMGLDGATGARSADLNRRKAGACENEAAWIQLQQGIRDVSARLNSTLAAYCGLTAEEQALLEQLPVQR
jgi:hypothetical protein